MFCVGVYFSLRKHRFLLALRRRGRFARNVPIDEERGETDVVAGYVYFKLFCLLKTHTSR